MSTLPSMPPPQPVELVPDPPVAQTKGTAWHRIFGIISILLGSMNLLGAPIILLAMKGEGVFELQGQDIFSPYKMLPPWFAAVSTCVDAAMGAALLVVGILLVMRRRAARVGHIAWALAAMVWHATSAVTAASTWSQAATPSEQVAVISLVLAPIVICGYPIFLLIWFMRKKIARQVAAW